MDEQNKNNEQVVDDELAHYGVKGMKWGVIGGAAATALGVTIYKKKREKQQKYEAELRKLSDAELNNRINRMRLEQTYAELSGNTKRRGAGKRFVGDVLKRSGTAVATGLATYAMGAAVNSSIKAYNAKGSGGDYSTVFKDSFKEAFSSGDVINIGGNKKKDKDK